MRAINVAPHEAEETLLRIANHVPPQIEIGRPLAVCQGAGATVCVVTDTALWWVYSDRVERLTEIAGGECEWAEFAGGVELKRTVTLAVRG